MSKAEIAAIGILTVFLTVAALLAGLFAEPARAMPNPAAVYCEALGYQYAAESTPGGERGLCQLPNNERVDAWDFLRGNVALEWSYCATEGHQAKHVEESDVCWDCTVCVLADGREVEVTQLMGLSFEETSCGDGVCGLPENFETCPGDCSSGGLDGYCDKVKDGICDLDCEKALDPDCNGGMNWALSGGIIAAVVVLGLVTGCFLVWMRRTHAASAGGLL
jgi:putative hemolysin